MEPTPSITHTYDVGRFIVSVHADGTAAMTDEVGKFLASGTEDAVVRVAQDLMVQA